MSNQFITINALFSIQHLESSDGISFSGNSHDYWKFIYITKGSACIFTDTFSHTAHAGTLFLLPPNTFHQATFSKESSGAYVFSFACEEHSLLSFANQTIPATDCEKHLLINAISEGKQAFSYVYNEPYFHGLQRRTSAPIGAEQLTHQYLEQALIHLARRHETQPVHRQDYSYNKPQNDTELFHSIVRYMELHLSTKITIPQICRDNTIARSQLQKLFQKKANCGVIDYFSKMKIDAAKKLIQSQQMNFTQISEQLGYTSVHYFSRQFKKITGITPSRYAKECE